MARLVSARRHLGWVLRIAVEDVDGGLGWSVDALDPAQ